MSDAPNDVGLSYFRLIQPGPGLCEHIGTDETFAGCVSLGKAFDEGQEVCSMFKRSTGKYVRLDIAIDGYCIHFPLWIFEITLG